MLHEASFRWGTGDATGRQPRSRQDETPPLVADRRTEGPYSLSFPPLQDQHIVLHRTGPAAITRCVKGAIEQKRVEQGSIHLLPCGTAFELELDDQIETVRFCLRRSLIEEMAASLTILDPCSVRIVPQIVSEDPTLTNLLELVTLVLSRPDKASPVFIDLLARSVAVHLIRTYGHPREVADQRRRTGTVVEAAIDYMRANMHRSIALPDIARAAGGPASASQFGRQFRRETGIPPHRYLINLRLQQAREMLANSQTPIAQIAYACGFANQEHMTRYFRREFQTTPAAYRRSIKSLFPVTG